MRVLRSPKLSVWRPLSSRPHLHAGPRYVNGAASSWWMVDLGAQHRLGITYYTLRHDGSNDYARSWVLQVGHVQQGGLARSKARFPPPAS